MSVGSKRNLSSGSLPGTGRAIADAVFLISCKVSSTLNRDAFVRFFTKITGLYYSVVICDIVYHLLQERFLDKWACERNN